jgi:hypothetical protein
VSGPPPHAVQTASLVGAQGPRYSPAGQHILLQAWQAPPCLKKPATHAHGQSSCPQPPDDVNSALGGRPVQVLHEPSPAPAPHALYFPAAQLLQTQTSRTHCSSRRVNGGGHSHAQSSFPHVPAVVKTALSGRRVQTLQAAAPASPPPQELYWPTGHSAQLAHGPGKGPPEHRQHSACGSQPGGGGEAALQAGSSGLFDPQVYTKGLGHGFRAGWTVNARTFCHSFLNPRRYLAVGV